MCLAEKKWIKKFCSFSFQWLPTKAPPSPCEDHVTLGLLLDTDHAFSIVNMGPAADSPEAAEFHSFWGEKAELRRFQDGSINEAVVWEEASQCGVAGQRLVCYQIIQHLLHKWASNCVHVHVINTDMNGKIYGALVQLGCYQHRHENGMVCGALVQFNTNISECHLY